MQYAISYERVDNVITKISPASKQDLFSRDTIVEADKGLIEQILSDLTSEYYYDNGRVLSRPKGASIVSRIKQLARKNRELDKIRKPEFVLEEAMRGGVSFKVAGKTLLAREKEYEGNKRLYKKMQLQHAEKELEITSHEVQARRTQVEKKQVYHCAIVAIAKNETPYLEEWLRYHLDLGIEHVFIHDDCSNEPIKTTVSKLSAKYKKKITVYDNKLVHPYTTQRLFYSNWLREWEYKVKWVSFLDIDEFINLKGRTSKEFLVKFENDDTIGEVNLNWLVYNAGGQIKKTNEPLRKRFKEVSPVTPHKKAYWLGKFFVKPYAIEGLRIHECILSKGLYRVTPDGYPVIIAKPGLEVAYIDPIEQAAFVEHYYTKSLEEWQIKMSRGAVDYYLKHFKEFYAHNPSMKPKEASAKQQVYNKEQ